MAQSNVVIRCLVVWMWRVCSCGRTYHVTTKASLYSVLSRCRKNHVEAKDLALDPLPKNELTSQTMLFGILGVCHQKHMILRLKKNLLEIGIAKDNIAVCYGFQMQKLTIPNHASRKHEICHYSVLHRWIPKIAKWLQKRRKTKRVSHVVWLLEADCQLAQLTGRSNKKRKLLTAVDLRHMASKQAITWPGYRKVLSRTWHQRKSGS